MKKEQLRITDKNIASYYGVSQQSLMNYKKSDDIRINRRYNAYRLLYIQYINSLDEAQIANFKENQKNFQKALTNENIFDKITV